MATGSCLTCIVEPIGQGEERNDLLDEAAAGT